MRIGLALKGLDYELRPVHLLRDGGEQHRADYRALNPMSQVPVLLADGRPVGQSLAILEFLEETVPAPPLLPGDAFDRALTRQMAEIVNSGIQPLQNLRTMQALGEMFGVPRAEASRWSAHWIEEGLAALEALVARRGAKFCAADAPTLADCCLVPQLYNARRFGVDLEPFPALCAVEARALELDAFRNTRPEVQPDAPS